MSITSKASKRATTTFLSFGTSAKSSSLPVGLSQHQVCKVGSSVTHPWNLSICAMYIYTPLLGAVMYRDEASNVHQGMNVSETSFKHLSLHKWTFNDSIQSENESENESPPKRTCIQTLCYVCVFVFWVPDRQLRLISAHISSDWNAFCSFVKFTHHLNPE